MAKLTINHHVGKRLRSRRVMLGLSQGDIAKAIGVAAQQVQKYEAGTNVMNVIRLHQFAMLLNVPVSYFFDQSEITLPRKGRKKSAAEQASDRESLEVAKSFNRIKDHGLRKRLADLTRLIAIKTGED